MDSDTLNRVARGVAFWLTVGGVLYALHLVKVFIKWLIAQFKK